MTPIKVEPARYLLRFDDLCPTMSQQPFERFLRILEQNQLRPILAVVPNNQDPGLELNDPDPNFWNRMCALQNSGATIAMHGLHHLCLSRGRSILSAHRETEFAGIPEDEQRNWIRAGLKSLRNRGLEPRLFVAPRHGFDRATLQALAKEGLPFLSDGFASRPYTRHGVCCIPQQLWAPVPKTRGLWTICIHTNTATVELEQDLAHFLSEHSHRFTGFNEVIAQGVPKALNWRERIHENIIVQRRRWSLKNYARDHRTPNHSYRA